VLLEATCCLLLIACLNVANLLVARAAHSAKSWLFAPHWAGAGYVSLRERLMECCCSGAGGALGLLLAFAALEWLTRTRRTEPRRIHHIDSVVAAFTVGVIMLCALFSGLNRCVSQQRQAHPRRVA